MRRGKQEMIAALSQTEKAFNDRREEILSDALVFEGCRSQLRRLRASAHGLRLIEDLRRRSRGWKKFFGFLKPA